MDFDAAYAHRIFLRPDPILTRDDGSAISRDLATFELAEAVLGHPLWQHAARNAALFETRLGPMIDEM